VVGASGVRLDDKIETPGRKGRGGPRGEKLDLFHLSRDGPPSPSISILTNFALSSADFASRRFDEITFVSVGPGPDGVGAGTKLDRDGAKLDNETEQNWISEG
jgi:hypothetical protein